MKFLATFLLPILVWGFLFTNVFAQLNFNNSLGGATSEDLIPLEGSTSKNQPPLNGKTSKSETFRPSTIKNPIEATNIIELIDRVINVLLYLAVPIVTLAIIYSGFLYIKALGKPNEITKATGTITWVLVGTAILLAAKVIALIILNTVKSIAPLS